MERIDRLAGGTRLTTSTMLLMADFRLLRIHFWILRVGEDPALEATGHRNRERRQAGNGADPPVAGVQPQARCSRLKFWI